MSTVRPSPTVNAARHPRRGYLYVTLAAVCWASAGSASKFLFNSGVSAFPLAQLRITLSCAILFGWLAWRRRELLRIDGRDAGYFLLLGTLGMAAINITYLYAISRLNVAAAILLQYNAPSLIALYTVLFRREKIGRATLAAIACALVGCYLVVGAYNLDLLGMNLAGIASGLGAAAAFAWWSVHGEYGMHRYDPWTVLFYALLVAAVEWNILHPPLAAFRQPYPAAAWGWILWVAVLGTIVPFGLYYEGINLIRATRASITSTLEPITAGMISYVFLDEVLGPLQVAGGVLVIAAVVLLQLKQEHDLRAPAVLRGAGGQAAGAPPAARGGGRG